MEESAAEFGWGVLNQTIFTENTHETMDSPRHWGASSPSLSSQESDLTAMNPLECCYGTSDASSVSPPPISTTGPEATSSIPSVDKFPGTGRFQMKFDGSDQHSNYSSKLEKIFVMRGTNVPFKFVWDWEKDLVSCPRVRAVLLFQSADIVDIIESCPVHSLPTDEGNLHLPDESLAKHVVRCADVRAQYCIDRVTGRHSVVVPLDPPQAGANNTTIMYSFACLSTCLRLKRRPTLIVFTLEDALGKVLGRDLLQIQVCASPKRDRNNAEKLAEPKPAKQGCSEKRVSTSASDTATATAAKRVKSDTSLEFIMVPVLNEAHRERVVDFAYGNLLVRIDMEQREATTQELQLIGLYTNNPAFVEHDTLP